MISSVVYQFTALQTLPFQLFYRHPSLPYLQRQFGNPDFYRKPYKFSHLKHSSVGGLLLLVGCTRFISLIAARKDTMNPFIVVGGAKPIRLNTQTKITRCQNQGHS